MTTSQQSPNHGPPPHRRHLSLRELLILILGVVTGVGAGLLLSSAGIVIG